MKDMAGQPFAANDRPALVKLPGPRRDSQASLEYTLCRRRSVREYGPEALALGEVSQLLWAAQGITDAEGKRTAPSAGALYPLELLLAAANVQDLPVGLYRYRPREHGLSRVTEADTRAKLASAALEQNWFRQVPAVIAIAAVCQRLARKYGRRAERYALMEVGHVAQNIHLQAEALDLGTVVVGAFDDAKVKGVLGLADDEEPFCLMPVGTPLAE